MPEPVALGGSVLGGAAPPIVVAEMSGNHNGRLDRALEIVTAAARAGARALKLQTYAPDTMTLDVPDGDFIIADPRSPWHGQTLYGLYREAHTPWEWHKLIFDRCRELGLLAFSAAFDATAVDFLERLDVPCHKIASFENTDLPLIRKAASTGKPLIISTGMATLGEIEEAVRTAHDAGCRDVILLKCTSSYPAAPDESHVRTIPHMRELFDCHVGLSDHTPGIGVGVAAVALGAVLVEKHLTLSRADGGVDAAFSLEPDEMRALVVEAERAWRALGGLRYGPTPGEQPSVVFRRSLYVAEDMAAGDVFTPRNLRIVRPGHGLPPKYYDVLLGKRVRKNVAKGTRVTWDLIE
ncbi:MAG: pseudaminic acid synthase [bacterium]